MGKGRSWRTWRKKFYLHRYLSIPKEQRTGLWMRKAGVFAASWKYPGRGPCSQEERLHVQGRLLRHKSPHCSPLLRRSLEGAEYTRPEELHGLEMTYLSVISKPGPLTLFSWFFIWPKAVNGMNQSLVVRKPEND